MERAGCKRHHAAEDGTIPSLPGGDFRELRVVYVQKTFLALA